ncbi:H-NS histone family protein [Pseudooceanicola nanhaiensis]|uniref:H-NS histone family protein n=1 Tax=Pseudooceanicola nanhaiensis TaxID=375761 RepID=UPI004058F42E
MSDTKHHGIDLKHLNKAQLHQLQKDVMKQIREFDDKVRQEAKAKLERAAAEMGFTLGELTGAKTTKRVYPARYAHPENPALTWSGKGRQPSWIKEHLEAGKSLDELLIKK